MIELKNIRTTYDNTSTHTSQHSIIVECSYIFSLNRSINSKSALLDCATIAFSE